MLLWVLCVAFVVGGLLASLATRSTWRTLWIRLFREPAPVPVASARGQFPRYGIAGPRISRAGPATTDCNSLRFRSDPSVC